MTYHRDLDDTAALIPKWKAGGWYSFGGTQSTTSTTSTGTTRVHPLIVPASVTIDRMASEVTTVPTDVDVVLRFGIWADDKTYNPTTLRFDAGISSVITTLDFYSASFSAITLTSGLWWVAAVLQRSGGGSTAFVTTNPACRTLAAQAGLFGSTSSLASNSSQMNISYSINTNNGALTNATPTLASNNSVNRVWVHCASVL